MFKATKQDMDELQQASCAIFQFIGDYGASEEWKDINNPLTKAIWDASSNILTAIKILEEQNK